MAWALVSPERANVDYTTFRNHLCCIIGGATGIVAYRHVLVVRTEVPGRAFVAPPFAFESSFTFDFGLVA